MFSFLSFRLKCCKCSQTPIELHPQLAPITDCEQKCMLCNTSIESHSLHWYIIKLESGMWKLIRTGTKTCVRCSVKANARSKKLQIWSCDDSFMLHPRNLNCTKSVLKVLFLITTKLPNSKKHNPS